MSFSKLQAYFAKLVPLLKMVQINKTTKRQVQLSLKRQSKPNLYRSALNASLVIASHSTDKVTITCFKFDNPTNSKRLKWRTHYLWRGCAAEFYENCADISTSIWQRQTTSVRPSSWIVTMVISQHVHARYIPWNALFVLFVFFIINSFIHY